MTHRNKPLPFVLAAALLCLAPALAGAAPPDDPGRVKFRGAAFPIAEEAGVVTVVVKRQRGDSGPASVDWATLPGTATAGDDYVEATGTLSWEDGDRSDKSFTIEIVDDDEDEGQETFGVELSNPSEGLEIGNPSTTVVRIKPSDRSGQGGGEGEGGVIKLTSASYPAFEASELAEVTVERSGDAAGPATVDYETLPGSATEGVDYLPAAGTLNWGDGETGVQSFTVTLIDDTEPEDLETITVVLTGATGAELGIRDTGSITIIDDDGGAGACVPDETTLCLRDGRFQVTGTWTTVQGDEGPFHWIPASEQSGFAWFFNETNIEFMLKILNGCPLNGYFWVFYAATTNVGFELEVLDLETGDERVYINPVGVVPQAVTDVTAFSGCE